MSCLCQSMMSSSFSWYDPTPLRHRYVSQLCLQSQVLKILYIYYIRNITINCKKHAKSTFNLDLYHFNELQNFDTTLSLILINRARCDTVRYIPSLIGLAPTLPGDPGPDGPVFLYKSELKKFASTPSPDGVIPVPLGSNFLFGDAT